MVLDALAVLGRFSDPLAWLVVAAFGAGALLERGDRERARPVVVAAWVLFGAFWLSLVYHFAFVQKSIVEGVGVALAVPACLSVATLVWRGQRDSLFVLSRSVAVMGVVFLPFETIPVLRQFLVETVTGQTAFLMTLVGHEPTVVAGYTVDGYDIVAKEHPYWSTFVFRTGGTPLTYNILIACTGVGSIAIFAGLIAAVRAPLRRKLRALAVSVPIIYGLNLVRNVFIGLGFGTQRFQVFPEAVMTLFAVEERVMVSYYVADRLIAQSLSVVALVAIAVLVARQLPELLTVVEDVLYVLTRQEYDLRSALGVPAVRTDGEGAD
jgi:archaeosortase A (PGF-CTERM-specific)